MALDCHRNGTVWSSIVRNICNTGISDARGYRMLREVDGPGRANQQGPRAYHEW